MAEIKATWHISLICECPSCNACVDLLDYLDFWDGRKLEFGERGTIASLNTEAHCPICHHDFFVDLEY